MITCSSTIYAKLIHKQILVCGDGDFSFSLALSKCGYYNKLVSTTLDSRSSLIKHFPESEKNIDIIVSSSPRNIVEYNRDATKLEQYYKPEFDVILWNFPHIIGKSNIRYNRKLVQEFLVSAKKCLLQNGVILCTLCSGQSGIEAKSIFEWTRSWKLPIHAAEAGLIITKSELFPLEEFIALGYQPKGHRGFGTCV
jgi:hypothetical protein